jgi:polysaccharide pyruvyl transferase WcaK-like protein
MFEYLKMWRQTQDFTKSGNVFDTIYGMLTWLLVQIFSYSARFLDLFGLGLNKKWKPGEKLQILLMAYSGARNTGAEVRVAELIDQLNQILGEDNVDVNMTTLNLADAREYFKNQRVNLLEMSYIFFWDVFRFILNNHVVVLVEGSCWKENFASALLYYFIYSMGLAAKLGKVSFCYGVDAGPMNKFNNFLSWALCRKMDMIITRSAEASDWVQKLHLKVDRLRVDTAWTLRTKPLEWGAQELKKLGWDGAKPLLGLAMQNFFWWPVIPDFVKWVRGVKEYSYRMIYYYDYDEQDKQDYEKWKQTMAQVMDWAAEKYHVQPVLIAMEALDHDSCLEVQKLMKNKSLIVSCREYVGVEIGSMLRNLSTLVTTRYHAMVLAMPGAVPFIGLSRDERIRGVMKETGLFNDYYVDYKTPDLAVVLQGKIDRLLSRPEERNRVSQAIREKLPYYFAQMALLGLDVRGLIKKRFPQARLKPLNEDNPLELAPFIPEELRPATIQKFLEIKSRETTAK